MKKKARKLMGLAAAAVLVGTLASSASASKPDSSVVVKPSGDELGITDAANIEAALRQADGGGVVKLKRGDYYVSRAIDVPGFDGALVGKGKEKRGTTINVVENDTPGSFLRPTPYWDSWFDPAFSTLLFNFDPVNPALDDPPFSVHLGDMTIKVADADPAAPHYNIFLDKSDSTSLNNILYLSGGNPSVTLENLKIETLTGDIGSANLVVPLGVCGGVDWAGTRAGERGTGDHRIVNVDVEFNAAFSLEVCGFGVSSSLYVDHVSVAVGGWGAAWFDPAGGMETTVVCSKPDFLNTAECPDE
jgi:hypothetical protein